MAETNILQANIFGAYDVRGVYGKDLSDEDAHAIARIFSRIVGKKTAKIVVGRDNRLSSPALFNEFTRGLLETGKQVIDVGIVPTPVLYYATAFLKTDGGAMITASHNPAEYNGIKLCKQTMPLSTKEMKKLEQAFAGKKFGKMQKDGISVLKTASVDGEYAKHVRLLTNINKSIKIVADAGNGVCGSIAGKIFDLLGVDYSPIYFESDGRFPHHHPDPSKEENLSELKQRVAREQADLGIAFDGDGDRVAFTDETGTALSPDDAGLLLAEKRLREKPGATVIYELRSSMSVREKILEWGGKPLMVKAGRIAVREAMQETGAEIGFETSGHICFAENYGFDDGLYAAAKMIELVSHADEPLSNALKRLPHYHTTREIRLHCLNEKKFVVVETVKKELKKSFKVNELDGVRVETSDSWGLLRVSNTEPAVTLRFEAKNEKKLDEIYAVFNEALKPHEIKLPTLKQAMQ